MSKIPVIGFKTMDRLLLSMGFERVRQKGYGMESPVFYQRFEAGELGDTMDFFEWSGLYKLRQDALEKIRRLESAL